jgi:predicted NBD/HSP70 family sugar kinase
MPDPRFDLLIDHLDRAFFDLADAAGGDPIKAASAIGTHTLRVVIDLALDGDPEARELLEAWAGYIADGLAGRDPAPDPSSVLH